MTQAPARAYSSALIGRALWVKSFSLKEDKNVVDTDKSLQGTTALISQDIPNVLPAVGVISQNYSKEHPAIDIAVEKGTPIVATISGEVVFAGKDKDLGNTVIIQNNKYKTVYGHNSLLLVEKGDIVKKGDIISLAGSTGHSSGPHVHYELYIKGKSVDPEKYIMK
jgi:murein DD-endopeptidase MepM/ murein hydrolase activator NlpD